MDHNIGNMRSIMWPPIMLLTQSPYGFMHNWRSRIIRKGFAEYSLLGKTKPLHTDIKCILIVLELIMVWLDYTAMIIDVMEVYTNNSMKNVAWCFFY